MFHEAHKKLCFVQRDQHQSSEEGHRLVFLCNPRVHQRPLIGWWDQHSSAESAGVHFFQREKNKKTNAESAPRNPQVPDGPARACPTGGRGGEGPGEMGSLAGLPIGVWSSTYLLKTQLFNFLGNMGYMSVKD